MGGLDYTIIGVYLAAMAAVGFVLQRRAARGMQDYFLSGKGLPWWLAGTSMAATGFSADTPLYITDITRQGGLGANWEWWCYAIGSAFSVYFLARLWRRAGVLTDVELSELRYGGFGARLLRGFRALTFSVFVNCLAMALVVKAIVSILSDAFGVDPTWLVPISLVVTAAYSLMSGFWGVVVTDFIQFLLAMAGAIALAVATLGAVGGLDGLSDKLAALPQSPLNFLPRAGDGVWESLPAMVALIFGVQWWAFINSDGGGKVIQRQLACRDEREAARATLWFTATHYALRVWPWLIVALASLVLLPADADGPRAYVTVMLQVMPDGWRGFMIATFLAAFMSTIDTQLNWGTSYFVNDFYARFIRPRSSDRHLVRVSQLVGLAFLGLTALLAFTAESVTSIFRFILSMGAGVGPIYILRWFWWRVNAWTEITAMTSSMVVATLCRLSGLDLRASLVVTLGISLPLALAVTYLTPPVDTERLRAFVARTRPFGLWAKFRAPDSRPDPVGPALVGWLACAASVFLMLFGVGWLLFGQAWLGGLALAAAIVCGWIALRAAERA
ncbi:MAG: sodium:proline symporter [Myxococcales bacterium]|nr:MAG: sodium:proline symporter [Myxococcales bacterium]